MEFLKEILGEDLYSQTKEKVDAYNNEHKDSQVKIANLGTGEYVSKNKFDDKEKEISSLTKQLSDANNEIQSYKDMDIDSIKKSADDWKAKYEENVKAQEAEKNKELRDSRVNEFFKDIKFSSESAKAGVIAKFNEKDFKYDETANKFQGGSEWLEEVKKNDSGAFLSDVANPTYTATPTSPTSSGSMDKLREAMGLPPETK